MIFNGSKFNSHWSTKTLKELGEFNRGKSKHRPRNDKKLFENGKYPLVQTGDVKEANLYIEKHSAEYSDFGLAQSKLWSKNTLCITIAANIAETSILSYDMCFPDSVVGFVANKKECTEVFMHYVFTYIKRSIQERIQGSIQDNINIEYLTSLKFKIPEKKEREAIENILFKLDSKIELNNKINTELEGMAKLLYDYWFVQFDFPDTNGKPYKASGGKMVYNEQLKRDIPEGWEVKELSAIAELKAGGDKPKILTSTKSEECKVPIYSNGVTNEGLYGFTNKAKIFKQSITVTGRGANVGHSVLRNIPFLPIIRLLVITPKESFHAKFLHERIKELNFQNSGSAQPQITVPQISSLPILMPSAEILKKYDDITSSGVKTIVNNKEQNRQLSDLRDWLLPMLMNGQVTVGGGLSASGFTGLQDEQDLNIAAEERGTYGK